jgi:hypothetical protein
MARQLDKQRFLFKINIADVRQPESERAVVADESAWAEGFGGLELLEAQNRF